MKKIKIYQVDAFTDKLFAGNPAAVCILDSSLDEALMQSIGNENNLAETAFVVPRGNDFEIRWFTPSVEVDLCGHATLAAAYVLFELMDVPGQLIRFHSVKSGLLSVAKNEGMYCLDFPTDILETLSEDLNARIEACIGICPQELYKGKTDYVALIESEQQLLKLQPALNEIAKLPARGLIVTAKGEHCDFVSRFFAPQSGISEDPVTGSAHTTLIPIWSQKLGKRQMTARQLSKRGGLLYCEYQNERCVIGGKARLFFSGEINLE